MQITDLFDILDCSLRLDKRQSIHCCYFCLGWLLILLILSGKSYMDLVEPETAPFLFLSISTTSTFIIRQQQLYHSEIG